MRIAVTGTPGTGKTTATELLADREGFAFEVVHLNDAVREYGLSSATDSERDSLVVDLDAVRDWLADEYAADADLVLDSHLAHLLDVDRVVVLRAHPERIHDRLLDRGESEASAAENAGTTESSRALTRKARENAESEALDVILSESVDRHGANAVFEVDTTDREPGAVAEELAAIARSESEPAVGIVDFTDYLVGSTLPEPGAESTAEFEAPPDDEPGGDDV